MQFSAVENRFIVTTYLYSTFANDLKRKYFFSKNVHSYRVCSFKRPLKKKTKNCLFFQDQLSHNAGQKYCRMLLGSILQYFWPAFNAHLSKPYMLCISLSGRFRQVLLYSPTIGNKIKYGSSNKTNKQFAKITLFTLDNSLSLHWNLKKIILTENWKSFFLVGPFFRIGRVRVNK